MSAQDVRARTIAEVAEQRARGTDDRLAAVVAQALATTEQRVAVVELATLRIVAVSRRLAMDLPGLNVVGRDATQFLVGGPSDALPLLASGQIDGYELPRRLALPGGVEDAYIWVHALGVSRPARAAVAVVGTVDVAEADSGIPAHSDPTATVIGTVDDEWRIDRVSADVHAVLGRTPESLCGVSILTLVHPGDLSELLTGLGHAQRSGCGVAVRVRARKADGGWLWLRAKVSPVGPRAAFAFALAPLPDDWSDDPVPDALAASVAHIVRDVHTARVIGQTGAIRALGDVPERAALTTREWEVVTAVRMHPRIDDVARSLHLSSSTVRNHLSAVYRKLGVRSLAELLVALQGRDEGATPQRKVARGGDAARNATAP